MGIKLRKKSELFTFYQSNGEEIERETEIRFDPLTGETSRIVFDSGLAMTPTDYEEAAEQTGGSKCPFCPENIFKMTPVFPKEVAETGRINEGEAIVFPNLFPYSKHNGVVVFSGDHYLRLHEFSIQLIKDAFSAAQKYVHRVRHSDSKAKYASINWNYMPQSGGSILHPHLHLIISDSGTNYQTSTYESARQFETETGKKYFSALYDMEKTIGERWIGEQGQIAWMHAFSPKSHNDFLAIFNHAYSIEAITDNDWTDFAVSLKNIFAALAEQGFSSFNMILSMDPEEKEPVHVRLIPRLSLGMLGTSDINFFQSLHQEPLTYKKPEDIAAIARKYFSS